MIDNNVSENPDSSIFGYVPVLLGFAGAVFILAFGGITFTSVIASMMFLVAGAYSGVWSRRQHESRMCTAAQDIAGRNQETDSEDSVRELEDFFLNILPIWNRNIESARKQVDEAITSIAGRFAVLVQRLDAAIKASRHHGSDGEEGGVVEVFECSITSLQEILSSIRSTQQGHNAMLGEIRQLSGYIEELREIAAGVAAIAAQSGYRAANDNLAAPGAGDTGTSGSVDPHDQGGLTRQVTEKASVIDEAIASANKVVERVSADDDKVLSKSENAIREVMEKFSVAVKQLTDSAEVMQGEGEGIRQEIEHMLVELQFQDRTSQILAQVRNNLAELEEAILVQQTDREEGRQPDRLDLDMWLQKMEQSYAMLEQRMNHAGQASPSPDQNEITFF